MTTRCVICEPIAGILTARIQEGRQEVNVPPPMAFKRPKGGAGRTLAIRFEQPQVSGISETERDEPNINAQPAGINHTSSHSQTGVTAATYQELSTDAKLAVMFDSIQKINSTVATLVNQKPQNQDVPQRRPRSSFRKAPTRRCDRERTERLVSSWYHRVEVQQFKR